MRELSQPWVLFCCLPGSILLLSFVVICLHTGTPWPWVYVVHEDGQRTLLETIFYFEHATRELPLDILLGAAIGGSVLFSFPPQHPREAEFENRHVLLLRGFAALTVLVMVVIVGGAALTGGEHSVLDNLAQKPTRPGASLVWGAHWRYHLLERLATMLLALGAAGVLRMRTIIGTRSGARGGLALFGTTLVVFALLTLFFRPTAEPFREVTFLGHQARELFTHTLVTLPLALGTSLWLARQVGGKATVSGSGKSYWPIAAGAAGGLLGLYLAVGVVLTGAHTQGQTENLVLLIFPHFFEHTFTYLVVSLVGGFFYLWSTRAIQSFVKVSG